MWSAALEKMFFILNGREVNDSADLLEEPTASKGSMKLMENMQLPK